ncbi:MAG TPA: 3-hydroxybutyrate dehydrogenase [Steroidobacteraceae bacterium]|nr:3-hydroxybutyrate dehydrogenase [Steroidobacteraceae bacterium]
MHKRNILITGAGSGIGAGLAVHLAEAGHRIVVTDLDGAAAALVARGIEAAGGRAHAAALDVSDVGAAAALFADPITGPVEVVVNNAGLQHVSRLEDFDPARWQLLVNVMLVGAANMMRAALPGMRARGHGRIVNIGSIHSLVASPYKSAYIAAKHGLIGLSKTVALENGDVDITVNTICPAYVRTPLVDQQIARQAAEHDLPEERVINEIMLRPMPKGSFITIAEIATAVEYFLSDAAKNVTAQALAIDGGWTAA